MAALFEGFDLVRPGLTRIPEWRQDGDESGQQYIGKVFGLAGVGLLRPEGGASAMPEPYESTV